MAGDGVADETRLRLAPGVDAIQGAPGELHLVSDLIRVRLQGPSARAVRGVLARLDGTVTVGELVAGWPASVAADLRGLLSQLVAGGALEAVPDEEPGPFLSLLYAGGLSHEDARRRLRELTVAVVGCEGPGGHLATALSASGVGRLILVDPFPLTETDRTLLPPIEQAAVGSPRQRAVGDLARRYGTRVSTPLSAPPTEEGVRDAVAGADLLACCFDKGLGSAAHWVNAAALDRSTPAGFVRLDGHIGLVGPIVLPHESPCYMCSRIRAVSCADDFAAAMAREELLDQRREPRLSGRPGLPSLAAQTGSLLAFELLKVALAFGSPALVGTILKIDALTSETTRHRVLQFPQCPVCRKKALTPPPGPDLAGLRAAAATGPGLRLPAEIVTSPSYGLVGSDYGIVRSLGVVPRDTDEPAAPVVYRAELANHRLVGRDEEPFAVCSGKGMTGADALVSALGEACERYCGSRWTGEIVRHCRRAELPGPSLDPAELVLYTGEQHRAGLPYAPWRADTPIGWVEMTDLTDGSAVWVPAIAVLMDYRVGHHAEFLAPITSNGLAAGPDLGAAVLAATLEVIERDAFVLGWLRELPPRARLSPYDVPDPGVRTLAAGWQRRGIDLELYVLHTDMPVTVVLALGADRDLDRRPSVVAGLAAHPDWVTACRKAALEVGQVRPALRARLRDPATASRLATLVATPSAVATLEEHDLLFADASARPALDFLRSTPVTAPAEPERPADPLAELVRHARILYRDLTTPDVAGLGVHVARAVLPGFQPIHFGAGEPRLAGRRLRELPERLGVTAGHDGVNLYPHPLA
ncbi:TOMM precursor leader peptide-binding protein [Actinoplanes sp. TBRC 11911]|uniref:TOMM precursor leader peptide-binding protein n=1 Tax=Actinoplanes sp. TBRC 11911 TaxID=2729386 RepID=UPI00145D05CE|nr:TOMM precursor leader peptide-binding protein [Actinoplanes sp. TBRC 11911]NMO51807.1 TOMM precursor leader peptide-binding protein [Actinoplanes sp. TBRC 11911]